MTAGRGRAKMSPERCAAEILAGVRRGATEIAVGRTRVLRLLQRVSPALAYRVMRDG
jgi:hypothetical protein